MNNGYFKQGDRGQIESLRTICTSSTQEETRENMMKTVRYKESITNDSKYIDVHMMLKEMAMSFGMKDYTRDDVESYLLKDGLTSLVYCKGIDTIDNVKPIVDTLLTGNGWHSVDVSVYSELINSSSIYKDVMDKHPDIEYVDCKTSHNTNIRKQVTSGDKLYYEVIGEDERFSTYDKIKMTHKMNIIDDVLESKTKEDWLDIIKNTIPRELEEFVEREDNISDYVFTSEDDSDNASKWHDEKPITKVEESIDTIDSTGNIKWV